MTDQRSPRARTAAVAAPAVVVAVVVVLGVLALTSGNGGQAGTATASPTASAGSSGPAAVVPPQSPEPSSQPGDGALPDEARRKPGDPLAMGKVDAPVVMVVWSDFQCPFCGRFARETEPTLVKRFVDTGVLRIEWRDFPYLGADSETAAIAGRAAAAQGKFWAFHDAVYATEHRVNKGDLSAAHLRDYAAKAGLDLARYDAAMRARAGEKQVQSDLADGVDLGITGTPAFLVNGRPVLGAQPTSTFVQLVEQAAAAAR